MRRVTRKALAILLTAAALWGVIGVAPEGGHPPLVLTRQYWGTFYYPWYGDADDLPPDTYRRWRTVYDHDPPATWASNYLPDNGSGVFDVANLYGSTDRNVINRHLSWLERGGFDFVIVSWWGRSTYEDRVFSLMLDEVAQYDRTKLSLTVYYEIEGFSDPSVEQIVSDLRYLYESYAKSQAFFTVPAGAALVPVVFVYGVDDLESTLRWARARDAMYSLGTPMFIVLQAWRGTDDSYRGYAGLVDGWHAYGAGWRLALVPGFGAAASPARSQIPEFGNWPLFRRDPVDFAAAVRTMARLTLSQAKFLLVATFNEWHEGTQIEPAFPVDHNDSTRFSQAGAGYGLTYIDIVGTRGQLFQETPPPSATGCLVPPPSLVTWWSGDGTPVDLVGFNMGTLYNRIGYAAGKVGLAFEFGGVDDWVLAPGMYVEDLQRLTIDFWVRLDSMPPDKIERFVTLNWAKAVLRYDGDGPRQLHFYMEIDGALRHIRVDGRLQIGVFHHIAGTYDGQTMRLYLDGTEVGSLAASGFVSSAEGVALSTGDNEAMHGLLDEVQLFDRALSAGEVRAIYEAGTTGLCKST